MDQNECRICGDKNSPTVDLFSISVQDHSMPYLIHRYLYFKVEKEDGLSQEICGLCFMRIMEIHKFAKLAAEIQEMFILLRATQSGIEPAPLVEGENSGFFAFLLNNEENTDCLPPLKAEERADCLLNNYENAMFPEKTPDETMETQEKNCFESGSGGKELVISAKLPKNYFKNISQSEDVNERQQKEEVKILTIASELVMRTSDHTLDNSFEMWNTLLCSNNVQTEGENTVKATEVEKSVDRRQPDNTYEENSEEENHIQSNQNYNISRSPSSDGSKIENRLLTNLQILLYKCPYCNYNNSEKHLLKKHVDRRHNPIYNKLNDVGGKVYFCKLCNKGFLRQYRLNYHYRLEHKDDKPYKCELCDKKFLLKDSLKRHFLLHGTKKSDLLICSICQKTFPRKRELKRHIIRVHENNVVYKCDICNKNILIKYNLQRHIYAHLHLSKRTFKCKRCKKNFHNLSELIKHMLNNSKKMPYTCNLCKMDLVPNYKLYEHFEYEHEGEVSVKCEICDKTLMTKDSLKKHFCPHEGAKLYVCPICQKIFSDKQTKSRHITNMHEAGARLEYKCDICKVFILDKRNLMLHIDSHLRQSDRQFKCNLCNFRCSYKYQLDNHFLSLMHGGNRIYTWKKNV